MLNEPVAAGLAVIVESGKPHFLVSGNAYEISSGDTDNADFFGHPYQHSYGERYVAKKSPFKIEAQSDGEQ